MKLIRTIAVSSLAVCGTLAFTAAPAQAQATRTWVSGVGDDANPCSRTAPCKTFAGAISKTATNGEINCLDPGGFGGVTITKGLSIVCQYTEGGILSAGAGVNGIVVNAPATSHVYLKGLDLHGAGSAQNGIRFIAGASLTVEESTIRAYNASNGLGMSLQPSGASEFFFNDVTVNNNGTGATGGGILVQPTGVGGSARINMVNVRVDNNASFGVKVDTTGNTSATGTSVAIANSSFSGNNGGAVAGVAPQFNSAIEIMVVGSQFTSNSTGLAVASTGAPLIRVSGNSITGNTAALSITGGGQIRSYGDNLVDGNGSFTGFSPGILPKF